MVKLLATGWKARLRVPTTTIRAIMLVTKTFASAVVLAPTLKKFVPVVIFLIMKVNVIIRPHSINKHNGS
jgi:hypothetical protein